MTNTYETIFICPGDIAQDKIEAAVEKVKTVITRAQGKISNAELWGRRKLAYPIEHHRDGFYVYLVFSSPPEVMADLEHHYRVTDTIVRGLTVKVDPRHLEKMKPKPAAVAEPGAPLGDAASVSSAPAAPEAAAAAATAAKSETPSQGS